MSRIDLFVNTHVHYAFLKSDLRFLADERDKKKFLDFVFQLQREKGFQVFAFVVLDNETHFLLGTGRAQEGEVKVILRELSDWLRQRATQFTLQEGAQIRITEEISRVNNGEELLDKCVQIHFKPVYQQYVKELPDYWWSSYQSYRGIYQWSGVNIAAVLFCASSDAVVGRRLILRRHRKYSLSDSEEFPKSVTNAGKDDKMGASCQTDEYQNGEVAK